MLLRNLASLRWLLEKYWFSDKLGEKIIHYSNLGDFVSWLPDKLCKKYDHVAIRQDHLYCGEMSDNGSGTSHNCLKASRDFGMYDVVITVY